MTGRCEDCKHLGDMGVFCKIMPLVEEVWDPEEQVFEEHEYRQWCHERNTEESPCLLYEDCWSVALGKKLGRAAHRVKTWLRGGEK
jgi:hypothetical protein